MKLLLVSLYFPPAGGGGVQRPLKFASHLPALGIETHVLAPDDPKWIHRDDELAPPTQAWVHRARYIGPRGRKPAEELHGRTGLDRIARQAQLVSRRLLVPDENVSWNLTAIPAAIRIVRQEGIDVVLTTSPPSSVHLIGAAGKRDPRPFLTALAESGLDVVARFVGDFRSADREWAEGLDLGDRLELHAYVPRRRSLELQRDSDALLLLIPEAGGRGKGVLSGKVFEYLAAERPILAAVPPDGAAAKLLAQTGAAVIAPPDDSAALRAALEELHGRWVAGTLDAAPLSEAWREKLSRASRVEELADVLERLA